MPSDEIDAKARALCISISRYGFICKHGRFGCEQAAFETCDCTRVPEVDSLRKVTAALREARESALRQAARKAEELFDAGPPYNDEDEIALNAGCEIAKAILALIDQPTETKP